MELWDPQEFIGYIAMTGGFYYSNYKVISVNPVTYFESCESSPDESLNNLPTEVH
jgi:hypothetical protein